MGFQRRYFLLNLFLKKITNIIEPYHYIPPMSVTPFLLETFC